MTKANIESYHGYKIGQIVYVKPNDSGVLKGKVTGFQRVDNHLPIVECDHPYKKGEKFSNAFDLDRISKTKTVSVIEWKLVTVKHTYKK
jgi:hypothetical protein